MKCARLGAANSSLFGHIGKRPISIIAVENVAAVLRNQQVRKSIVVVVAPHTSQPVTCPKHARLFGHIGEYAIAIVTIKRVANRDAAVVQIAPIYKIDVQPAVAVKVGHADSWAKFFPVDGDAMIALEVNKLNAS